MFTNIMKSGVLGAALVIGIFSNIAASHAQVPENTFSQGASNNISETSIVPTREQEIDDLLNELPYETSRVTTLCQRKWAKERGIVTGELKNDVIVQEYFRSNRQLPDADEGVTDSNNLPRGLGVRVTVVIHSRKGGLNIPVIPSLLGIGLAAEANKITGTISVETFGLGGRLLTAAMPVPAAVSLESMNEALAAIKNIKAQLINSTDQKFITTRPKDNSWAESVPIINFPIFEENKLATMCNFLPKNR